MSKNSSAIYITKISKQDYKKRLLKEIRIFPKTKKNKNPCENEKQKLVESSVKYGSTPMGVLGHFELYQVFMCQTVLIFPNIYLIHTKN